MLIVHTAPLKRYKQHYLSPPRQQGKSALVEKLAKEFGVAITTRMAKTTQETEGE